MFNKFKVFFIVLAVFIFVVSCDDNKKVIKTTFRSQTAILFQMKRSTTRSLMMKQMNSRMN